MRDPNRIKKICTLLEILWNKYPDQRLGQLLENYVFGHHDEGCIFYQKDTETISKLLAYTKKCYVCGAAIVSTKIKYDAYHHKHEPICSKNCHDMYYYDNLME